MIEAYREWPLRRWEKLFTDIYAAQNRRRSAEEVWYRLIEEISELVHLVESQKLKAIEGSLPDVFAWLNAFAAKKEFDLQKVLWQKFQKGCPSCSAARDCGCMLSDDVKRTGPVAKITLDSYRAEPRTLDEWQNYFRELYGKTNERVPPMTILGKLVEDAGGVAKAMRKRENFEWKVASVFAWLMALANRYSEVGRGEISLSQLVWAKYENACPKCFEKPCECTSLRSVFISYPGELKGELDLIQGKLRELQLEANVFPEFRPDFSDGRMAVAFDEIDRSDAGIVLLGKRFSPQVYAEYLKLLHDKDRNLVFVYVTATEVDEQMATFLKELGITHRYTRADPGVPLLARIERDLGAALERAAQPSS